MLDKDKFSNFLDVSIKPILDNIDLEKFESVSEKYDDINLPFLERKKLYEEEKNKLI